MKEGENKQRKIKKEMTRGKRKKKNHKKRKKKKERRKKERKKEMADSKSTTLAYISRYSKIGPKKGC